jgi:hypothetical protein
MAVVDLRSVYGHVQQYIYIGLSTDTKPTDVPVGAKFVETDTSILYTMGSDRNWAVDPMSQVLNKVYNPDSLEWERMTQPLVNISTASLFVELASFDAKLTSIESNQDPLAPYRITEEDAGSATSYYGFMNISASWYIMRISNGSYLYTKGNGSYPQWWASRNNLSYTTFGSVF